MIDYAIVQTGGKQYRVQQGDTIRVESLPGDDGDEVELTEVLMVSEDGSVTVGTPAVPGAQVTAEVVGSGRGKKIIIYKQKPKTRYRRKKGHRQDFTRLAIRQIVTGAEEAESEAPKKRARRAPRTATTTETAAEPTAQAPIAKPVVEPPAAETKPARRTKARKAPAEKLADAPSDADKKMDGE